MVVHEKVEGAQMMHTALQVVRSLTPAQILKH